MSHVEPYSDIFRILFNPCICNRVTFRTLAHLELEASSESLSSMEDNQAYSEPWHSQYRLLKHFQGYLGIFIDTYSTTPTGVQLGGREGPHLRFFENRKKCPDCDHLWVKFFIQNVVLRVLRRKDSRIFPCQDIFLVFLMNVYRSAPVSETSLALKNFCLRACFQSLFFLQKAPS